MTSFKNHYLEIQDSMWVVVEEDWVVGGGWSAAVGKMYLLLGPTLWTSKGDNYPLWSPKYVFLTLEKQDICMQIIYTMQKYQWLAIITMAKLQKGGANVSDPFKVYFKKLSASA